MNTQTNEIINRQQQYLINLRERYNARTKASKQFMQKYRPILADNRAAAGFNSLVKEMFYPIVAKRSLGSRIWDIDDNEYIDFTMGLGVNLFGHNPSFVKEALQTQIEKGIQIGPQSELVGEVAQLICEMTGMERVAFSNTGTEAVMTAIRLARNTTERNKIVIFSGSYHGHFDGTLVKAKIENGTLKVEPIVPGIPPSIIEDVLVLEYGNPQSLEVIKANARELAAVLVVPVQINRPNLQPKDFLQELRQLTKESGIALIFDEMITGFRIHPGGAQAYFEVKADIATYGKIIGGGIPIGVIAGSAAYLNGIDGGMWNYGDDSSPQAKKTFFAGTFCKHPLAMAAAKAVLLHLKTQGASLQHNLNERTAQFVHKLNTYLKTEQVPVEMAFFGSFFNPTSSSADAYLQENSSAYGNLQLFYYHLLDRGIMIRGGGGYLSTAHTNEDIEAILDAIKDSTQELKEGGFLSPLPSR